MNSSQCRAARALINWSQGDLAKRAKVSEKTISDFEADKREPREQTITRLRTTLQTAGIVFIEEDGGGPGVRLKKKGKR